MGKIKDKIKNSYDDFMFDAKYGGLKGKAKCTLKVASAALDVATVATGVGTAVKVGSTAGKLAKCGKGAKMVTTFTVNAQKKNIAKAGAKAATYQAGKVASKTAEKQLDKKKK